ncbi:MAG TPA: sugar ABC transporter substrate-binding protein [Anaerolineales bacterium]|nr:sugar ABC transporter substrate-binding protein [Anaerolineales bacterium]
MRKRLQALGLLLCAVLLTNGCASSASRTAGGPLQVASPGRGGDERVAIVPPGFTSPFHIALKDGAIEAASQIGWKVDAVAAESEGDFAGQVAVVEQELQKGIAAIAINPIDSKAIVTAVREANKAHIPVFMHNLITPVDEGQVVEYIGYDQWNGAAKLAHYTCDLLGGKGNVYILMGIPGFHTDRRTQGYEWGLQQTCPGVKVIGEQTAEWDRTEAIEVATIALQQHPEINVFYGNSDEMAIGACIAAAKVGRKVNQNVWCLGIDGNAVTLDLIEKGEMTATLGVYPDRMGATIIWQMQKYLNGETVPFILETSSIVVDQKNVADYKAGTTWVEPIPGVPELDNGRPTGQ